MRYPLSLPTGLGADVHREKVGDDGDADHTPDKLLPWASWVRIDDLAPNDWNPGPGPTNSINVLRQIHGWYKDHGFRIAQDIDAGWGLSGHIVDHARDLLCCGTVDLLLAPNEPDLAGTYTATDYAGWCRRIKREAFLGLPYARLGGPQVSSWDYDFTIDAWLTEFEDAGGMEWIDVYCVHPYTGANAPATTIPAWLTYPIKGIRARSRAKPILFTEMGAQSGPSQALYGSHDSTSMAQLDAAYVAGCSGYPCVLYDAPYDVSTGGWAPPVSTFVSAGANSATQALNSTGDVVVGMQLAFFHPGPTPTLIGVRTVSAVGPLTVNLDSPISTDTNSPVESSDYNAALTYWVNGGWYDVSHVGQTPIGTDLSALLPTR